MGLATASLFVQEGAHVTIADISLGKAEELVRRNPKQCHFVHPDIRNPADLERMCIETGSKFGAIDVLVNNAGHIGMLEGIAGMTAQGWNDTFDGLLRGPALALHYALPWLKSSGGSVINIASTAGVEVGWGPMAYSVAKHGLLYLTEWAAVELAQYGVRVNAITPGLS